MSPIRALPFDQWPPADVEAWEALFAEGDIFDDAGPARHWAKATRKTNRAHYGKWLGWLCHEGLLDAAEGPADRATPERVRGYTRALIDNVAPRTVATCLIGVKCVLVKMAPDHDWRWLKDLTNRLDAWAPSAKAHKPLPMTAGQMFDKALSELERLAEPARNKLRSTLLYRDTLIIALLIPCPVRLKNLAAMEIGQHLDREANQWWLRFGAEETKTGQALDLILPDRLVPWLEHYLEAVRPRLTKEKSGKGLWLGNSGKPLAPISIYLRIQARAFDLFGTGLGSHAYRTLTATFLADTSPSDALRARPLLGHRQGDTTATHYIRANSIAASRAIAEALTRIRSDLER